MAKKEDINALLSKYFSGEATPEDAMLIDDWRKQHAEQFNILWNNSPLKSYQIPDVPAAWLQIHPLPRRQVVTFRWMAAAAVFLCIVVTAALLFKQPVSYTTIVANKTEKIVLPDSSMVTIHAGSKLTYGKKRDVILEGEADFDVKQLVDQPFIITAGPAKIKVLGTTFNVAETDTAVTVRVYSGKVMMVTAKDSTIVFSSQTVSYLKNSQIFAFYFNFENEDLKTVAAYLSEAYHKKIYFKDTGIDTLRISSNFENKPLDYILEVIATTLNITFTYSNQDEIYFEKN
jgi:ferric-dicitrate binding protein FerR (iron transport regulator)